MKKRKKAKLGEWVAVGIFIPIGMLCGVLMVDVAETMNADKASMPELIAILVLLFAMMYLAMYLQIVIHEAGHLIFGLATGYEFSSFRIGSLLWKKEDGKIKLKKYALAGTGGQCLMRPPKMVDGKIPVVLYNLGGSIMNLISAVVSLALVIGIGKSQPIIYYLFLIMAIIGIAYAMINGIPMDIGMVSNDGKNTISLGKNRAALRGLWIQLEMNHLLSTGVALKDMKKEWFYKPSEEDMQNNMTAALAVFRVNRLMEEMKFPQAKEEMEEIVNDENAVAGIHKSLLTNDLIYLELIEECDKANIDKLFSKEQRRFVKSMKINPSILRTRYAYALIYEKDQIKADIIKAQFEKIAKDYPYPTEIEMEKKYMSLAERKIEKEENKEIKEHK